MGDVAFKVVVVQHLGTLVICVASPIIWPTFDDIFLAISIYDPTTTNCTKQDTITWPSSLKGKTNNSSILIVIFLVKRGNTTIGNNQVSIYMAIMIVHIMGGVIIIRLDTQRIGVRIRVRITLLSALVITLILGTNPNVLRKCISSTLL